MTGLFRLGLWLAARLSERQARTVARWFAVLLRRSRAARDTAINLAVCFPEMSAEARARLMRQSLWHTSLLVFELAQLRHWPKSRLLGDLRVQGGELIDAALANGNGLLLLVPHFGNWELLCAYLGEHHSLAALYAPPKVAALEGEIRAARERFAGKMFPIGVGGIRSLIKELRAGRLVALLPDQVPERNGGVYADFYGQAALTMTLPHQLIERTQPEVVMGSVVREPAGGYTAIFERPLTGDGSAEGTATAINRSIERVIARDPAQYQWEYRRFKRPPQQGMANIYRRQ